MTNQARAILRGMLAAAMIAVGITHFSGPQTYVAMVPPQLPAPLVLVYVSGVAEIAGGLGLLIPRLRRAASFGLIALYLAVFPANIHMALSRVPFDGHPVPDWLLWLRLPFQALFIVWAYVAGRPDATPQSAPKNTRETGETPPPGP